MSTSTPTTNSESNVMRNLCLIAIGLFICAIGIPRYVGTADWWNSNTPAMGLWKTLELLILVALFGVIAAIGGIKITSSNAANMEWFGSALVFFGGLAIGAFLLLKGVSTDEFNEYRYLLSPRPTRSVAVEPEMKEVDWENGAVSFKAPDSFLWITLNVDYKDNDPLPRKSIVLYSCPEKDDDGFVTVNIPFPENAERVGVFFATSQGPSGESFAVKPETSANP